MSKPETTVTALAQRLDAPALPNMTALDAARRICVLYETARVLAGTIKAQTMEALWIIRREYPDPDEFADFVRTHTPIAPAEARLMADAWTAARANRAVRELAHTRPNDALAFIDELVKTGLAEQLEALDDTDLKAMRCLTLPPRKRVAAVKELIEVKDAVEAGHHPADREHIKALEVERDAAVTALQDATRIERLDDAPVRRLALRREKFDELKQRFYDFVSESSAELAVIDFAALSDAELVPYEEALGYGRNEILSLLDALDEQWRAHVREVL